MQFAARLEYILFQLGMDHFHPDCPYYLRAIISARRVLTSTLTPLKGYGECLRYEATYRSVPIMSDWSYAPEVHRRRIWERETALRRGGSTF